MRRIIYECDTCHKPLDKDDGSKGKPHISINFSHRSGWVSNHAKIGKAWQFDSYTGGIFQFCGVACLAAHFRGLAKAKR